MTDRLSRRQLLTRATVIGCSLAASPLLTPLTFAQAPWDTRLVVVILRGFKFGFGIWIHAFFKVQLQKFVGDLLVFYPFVVASSRKCGAGVCT